MSARISMQNGIGEMFVSGKPAWHKLGVNVQEAQTWKEAAKLAHINWQVVKKQLEYAGKSVDAYGLFRADNSHFLGSCGNAYEPIQVDDAFSLVDSLLTEGGAHYESAGALDNGSIIWTLARINTDIRISNTDDIIKNYLLFVDYRRQGKAAIVKMVMERVVCNNTMTKALSEKGDFFKICHNGDIQNKINMARNLVAISTQDVKSLSDKFNFLAQKKVDKKIVKNYLLSLFTDLKTSNNQQGKAERILELFEDNDNNKIPEVKGTAWNLLNATTQYIDHYSPITVRNADGTANIQMVKEQKRAESCLFGNGDEFKQQALKNILSLINEEIPVKSTNPIDNILSQVNI